MTYSLEYLNIVLLVVTLHYSDDILQDEESINKSKMSLIYVRLRGRVN